ncbi:hypothetical protein PAESOLCIP111_03930 [Paenibacillus solanacearum]|uniref:Uncharacterized protein n=1 Tax=Paenibacillus solanacearum TaxID=2048548 RepID=A0A916K782_9BACL|nr:hypothetical protein PAESOLCIP111_03930 [Paenibacillus solanacearum]
MPRYNCNTATGSLWHTSPVSRNPKLSYSFLATRLSGS